MLIGGGVAREAYFALTYFHVGLEAAALARIGLTRSALPRTEPSNLATANDVKLKVKVKVKVKVAA